MLRITAGVMRRSRIAVPMDLQRAMADFDTQSGFDPCYSIWLAADRG